VADVLAVRTNDAKMMARWIAREEALFAGTSSGKLVAVIQVAQRLGPNATVVTLMAGSGLKCLSTGVYRKR
jgi:cysteine synthase A